MQQRSLGTRLLRALCFPVLLGGPLALGWSLATLGGWSHVTALMAASVSAILPILVLQRLLPAHEAWRGRPSDFGLDLLHAVTTSVAGDLWRAVSFGLAFAVSAWCAERMGFALWPHAWPLALQAALALLIGDLAQYWLHRGMHESDWLWPIHAMHHSSERLYVFSATRTHPFNFILVYAAQMTPLILLGASLDVLFLVSMFTAVHGMLQHANIDFDHGPFNRIFATADLHRWHHSASYDESNANYGSNLILWDALFGTRFLPSDRTRPERMGLEGTLLPENWWVHLASPFTLQRYAMDTLGDLADEPELTLDAPRPSAPQPGAQIEQGAGGAAGVG